MPSNIENFRKERENQAYFLEQHGIDPYPGVPPLRTNRNSEIRLNYELFRDKEVSVVGRMTAVREHGNLVFFDLEDESGKLQAKLSKAKIGESMFGIFKKGFYQIPIIMFSILTHPIKWV